MNEGLEAFEDIKQLISTITFAESKDKQWINEELDIIEKELILLNALRNKLNRKIETKKYKNEASDSYRIATLLTYELKEQWNDAELQTLKQFLLNLSGISKQLKELDELAQALSIITCENGELLKYKQALEIIKNKCSPLLKAYLLDLLPKEEYDLLKEVLL